MSGHDTPVLVLDEALEHAYDLAYDRFDGYDEDPDAFDLSHYAGSAEWADVIAPTIRRYAGFGDHGPGTYTVVRDVVAVDADDMDDRPIPGERYSCADLLGEFEDAFRAGAYDAVHGRERHESLETAPPAPP